MLMGWMLLEAREEGAFFVFVFEVMSNSSLV
jgi:hypothetical protein